MLPALSYLVFKSALKYKQKPHFDEFIRLTRDPKATQWQALKKILQANQMSDFGREFRFEKIDSPQSFQESVPVGDFEALRSYIERQRDGEERALTWEMPVYYNRTSGTIGTPKDVPVTQQNVDEIRLGSQLSAFVLSQQSDVLKGSVFAIGGSAIEAKTLRGIPIGSASGMLYRQQSRFVRSRYVLPPEVFDIEDVETRYIAMAVYGLARRDVTTVATANPSTFVRLMEIIEQHTDAVLRHISEGTAPLTGTGLETIKPNPTRARELRLLLERKKTLSYRDFWPDLKGVVTWCGGSCGFALSKLTPSLPSDCAVYEFGYNSSEFRGTINVDLENNLCLPMFQHSYFEFVSTQDWENGRSKFVGLDELEDGAQYYIFATTSSGLYRYDINDIVRVSGRINATPTLDFVQKGRGVTNITGEKLTEHQVLEGINSLRQEFGVDPDFFVLLADEEESKYMLCMECSTNYDRNQLENFLDSRLRSLNIEYQAKRKSGRLGRLSLIELPTGTGYRFRSERVAAGQRDSQFKYLHLQYLSQIPPELSRHIQS
ncbi:MAG: GH3 auxin-responsive promoter family protein [Gammaproteobacteria bacterium]|nr:GH3 auxin-responsive promoter family protein [Gammaproteobacteria bacterium]